MARFKQMWLQRRESGEAKGADVIEVNFAVAPYFWQAEGTDWVSLISQELVGGAMAIKQITPEEAYRLMQAGDPYIDVRTEQEFANGHPAGAVNIPVVFPDPTTGRMKVNGDFVSVVAAHFPTDKAVIVGCQAGGRSQRAAEMLQHAGYTLVSNMQGGFGGARDATGRTIVAGWAASGLPVSNERNDTNSYEGLKATAKTQ